VQAPCGNNASQSATGRNFTFEVQCGRDLGGRDSDRDRDRDSA
jgi:hypothetical protein